MPSMINKFEWKGLWWLPNIPSRKIPGILKYNPQKRCLLELDGHLEEKSEDLDLSKYDIIVGITEDQGSFTLINGTEIHLAYRGSGLNKSRIDVEYILNGYHFPDKQSVLFNKLSINFTYLKQWLNISGFDKTEYKFPKMGICYVQPDSIQLLETNRLKLRIDFEGSLSFERGMTNKRQIEEFDLFVIEPERAESLDYYMDIMYFCRNLMTIGINEAVFPLDMLAHFNAESNGETYPYYVNVLCYHPYIREPIDNYHPFDMLFNYKDISKDIQAIFSSWFANMQTLVPILPLYFSTIFNEIGRQ